eukprot:752396-Prymnesium_polylepis.1
MEHGWLTGRYFSKAWLDPQESSASRCPRVALQFAAIRSAANVEAWVVLTGLEAGIGAVHPSS